VLRLRNPMKSKLLVEPRSRAREVDRERIIET
jgi:hypothetical protein